MSTRRRRAKATTDDVKEAVVKLHGIHLDLGNGYAQVSINVPLLKLREMGAEFAEPEIYSLAEARVVRALGETFR